LNGYVYVADPINASDYNGKWGFGDLFSAIVNVVKAVIKAVVTPVATVVRAVVSAVSQPKATAASSSGGGGRTGGSATTASVSPSSRVKKQSFSTGVDSLYLKNTVKSYGNPGGPSGSASVSYCAVICGGVGMNSGHPSVNFGVGIEAGIGIAADLSPGAANTGLEFGLGCSASMIHFEIGTGGVNGGFNLPTAKAGCGIQGSFTW
jgi:hypothetical protein